jgi:hypothetical protein
MEARPVENGRAARRTTAMSPSADPGVGSLPPVSPTPSVELLPDQRQRGANRSENWSLGTMGRPVCGWRISGVRIADLAPARVHSSGATTGARRCAPICGSGDTSRAGDVAAIPSRGPTASGDHLVAHQEDGATFRRP